MKTGACLTTVTNLRGPAGPGRKVRGSEKAPRLPRHVFWESRYFREKQRATKRGQKQFCICFKKTKNKAGSSLRSRRLQSAGGPPVTAAHCSSAHWAAGAPQRASSRDALGLREDLTEKHALVLSLCAFH